MCSVRIACHSYWANILLTFKIHQEQDIIVYLFTGKGQSHWTLPPTPILCLKYGSTEPRSHLTPATGARRAMISQSLYHGDPFITPMVALRHACRYCWTVCHGMCSFGRTQTDIVPTCNTQHDMLNLMLRPLYWHAITIIYVHVTIAPCQYQRQ